MFVPFSFRNDLTPLDFSVAVDGVEPNEMLTSPPSEDTLDQNLQTAGTGTCRCVPRAEGQVTLEGKTNNTELDKIKKAVHEAVKKENPGIVSFVAWDTCFVVL